MRTKWVRILAGILCIVSFNIAAGSFLLFAGMESVEIYDREKEEIRQEMFEGALRDYSILAMSQYEEDFGMEKLAETNFRYGVIQTDSIEGLDLNDKSIYEVCNFDKEVTKDELFVYSCNMGENTGCYAGKTLFDNFYIYNDDAVYQESYYPIEACYYVRNTREMYYLADGKLYPAKNVEYMDIESGEYIDLSQEILHMVKQTRGNVSEENVDADVQTDVTSENTAYIWQNPDKAIYINDMEYFLSDIQIITTGELEKIGKIVSMRVDDENYEEYHVGNGEIVTFEYTYVTSKPYYVVSYVNEPLATAGAGNYLVQSLYVQFAEWDKQDFFVQLQAVLNLVYAIQDGIYIAMFISVIVFFITLIVFMRAAGYEKGSEEMLKSWWEKMPYDLLFYLVVGVVCTVLAIVALFFMETTLRFAMFFGAFGVLGSEWLCLRFMESTAIRFKRGRWWSNTLVAICWRWCKRIVKICVNWCKKVCGKLTESIPFLWKAWIIMGALAFLEFVGILATSYNTGMQIMLWFAEKVVLYGALTLCLLQMLKLKQGAKKIADGEMDSQIPTEKMLFDFKEHGEDLNRIQEGIGKAVAERMKSERFKTELITNVSHDIKTPLTSIINYVDLLEKEDISNPKVQEYLEVLSRQSTRLKKLIEDLMEASKASTGNLAVAAECCDAGVMLTQTVGEFEEKLKAGQIELLVQNSKEPVYICADPRHLWRIFDNLMNNICKYALGNTRAYVNIEKTGGYGRIIFRNISKYALNIDSDELMERFVRGDSSRNTEGSGLGLSIAKSLTELMHGTFELVVDGDLFKVIVTFPITEKNDEYMLKV
ncbi:MAG: HAMP domain-containing histidine kinase [Lachnospiraceae bacterium]|nr:HAMP domain-containing histidine kinase [Lachnospiraceae bacterium]